LAQTPQQPKIQTAHQPPRPVRGQPIETPQLGRGSSKKAALDERPFCIFQNRSNQLGGFLTRSSISRRLISSLASRRNAASAIAPPIRKIATAATQAVQLGAIDMKAKPARISAAKVMPNRMSCAIIISSSMRTTAASTIKANNLSHTYRWTTRAESPFHHILCLNRNVIYSSP
jgi:hypothetical protein